MLSPWNFYLLLPMSLPISLCVNALTRNSVKERQQPKSGTAVRTDPMVGTEHDDFLSLPLSWPLSSSELSDRQGVIGEYADLQESTETSFVYPDEGGLIISRLTDSAAEDATSEESTQPKQQTLMQPDEGRNGSLLLSTQNGDNQPTFPALQKESALNGQVPFFSSGSPPSDQDSTSQLSAGPVPSPEHLTPQSEDDDLLVSKTNATVSFDENMHISGTPCKTPNQSWTPSYSEDFTPNESLNPSLALSPVLLVPLYSDWNSALATWGFAWEAHIYGLGSVFTMFSLISVVCLLGLPLRCPSGIPYLTLLHLFLLAFAGIQAFSLLYDAYSHQDRLPPLCSLLLSELPLPCLISAFSLTILLLSLRSRMHLSLPLPCLLLCLSLVHFAVSLGCVGILQLFPSLPTMILLFPHCMFVCLTIFVSCPYLIFYCLIQVNTKHIYRLNDSGESGGSPQMMGSASCPFAKVEDFKRAAGAGVGASLCLLGCGGFWLYGILHALGLGGIEGYGFQPWPWWGYQIGCRLCEVGVCLGLSLIGSQPLFCQNSSSVKTITHPRAGSWSRLSCSSPSRGPTSPCQVDASSPVLSSHKSCSQNKQDKLVICDITTKGQSEALPLFSMANSPGNGLDMVSKCSQTQNTVLPLPTPPIPPHKLKNIAESKLSSLDSLQLETDSTIDLRPPSPINLSRSIDQALFNESLFSPSIFGSAKNALYRTSSCGDVDQENALTSSRPSQPHFSLSSQSKPPRSPVQLDWKGSVSGSTQGLCSHPKETGKLHHHSWTNRGQNFAQGSLPRAIPHLSCHRHYRTLSLASQDSPGSGSKQLEWDVAVQAEFVNVCKQIDALSVCSDTIEL
uniref:Proline-rich transmembrane protein 3/4 domain-containing protein n=1 Tax=Mola mola TaxID=94237 RepID=A0A3Q3WQ58_MOLML